MERLLKKFETFMDDFKIKYKLLIFYIFCVLLPLIVTDSFIIYLNVHSEKIARQHEMENISNAVQYSFTNSIKNATAIAKSVYMNKYINTYLETDYRSTLDYVDAYHNFFNDVLFDNGVGIDSVTITLYSNNRTIVQGGKLKKLDEARDDQWYKSLLKSDNNKALCIYFDDSKNPIMEPKRRIMFVQRMNCFNGSKYEKVLNVELDYTATARNLIKMNYDMPVYICSDDKILLSNGDNSVGKDFDHYIIKKNVYVSKMSLYGMDFTIYIEEPKVNFLTEFLSNMPIIILLILINIISPTFLVWIFNRSFTTRLRELSDVFNKIDDENLIKIENIRGKDEIGKLMLNYNRMALRFNSLINTVYIAKMKEQETTVARKNAELLALYSQINPHFLFNALESIRMHSILKNEIETADMVKRLAIIQRQYLEWGNDFIKVEKEMELVKAYLELQKYRFGEKLSYQLEIAEECKEYVIPKLTVVTFVENACVHGIESKTTPGWIFVRIYRDKYCLYIEIEDTGIGMEDLFRSELLNKIKNSNLDMLKEKGRVGIINASLRLKIFTDDEARFELEGEKGVGTTVQMIIPLLYV